MMTFIDAAHFNFFGMVFDEF